MIRNMIIMEINGVVELRKNMKPIFTGNYREVELYIDSLLEMRQISAKTHKYLSRSLSKLKL